MTKLEKIQEMVRLSMGSGVLDESVQRTITSLPYTLPRTVVDQIRNDVDTISTELYQPLINHYNINFTPEEIDELHAQLISPLGQKCIELNPHLMSAVSRSILNIATAVRRRVNQHFDDLDKEERGY